MKRIAIAMTAEAAVKHEIVPYTGTRGLYASVIPQNVEAIMGVVEELGIELKAEKVHVTVCYSKKASVPIDKLPNVGSTMQFEAMCNEVGHWVGHKGQTCVVLKLVSLDINRLNAQLQAAGAEHTFTPYSPHITLSDDYPVIDDAAQARIDAINKQLALNPIELTLDRYQLGDQDN